MFFKMCSVYTCFQQIPYYLNCPNRSCSNQYIFWSPWAERGPHHLHFITHNAIVQIYHYTTIYGIICPVTANLEQPTWLSSAKIPQSEAWCWIRTRLRVHTRADQGLPEDGSNSLVTGFACQEAMIERKKRHKSVIFRDWMYALCTILCTSWPLQR